MHAIVSDPPPPPRLAIVTRRNFPRITSARLCLRTQKFLLSTFTPLVLSAADGLAREATIFYKRLASMLAAKWDQAYSTTLCWLRCRLASYVHLSRPSEEQDRRVGMPSKRPQWSTRLIPNLISFLEYFLYNIAIFFMMQKVFIIVFLLCFHLSLSCVPCKYYYLLVIKFLLCAIAQYT